MDIIVLNIADCNFRHGVDKIKGGFSNIYLGEFLNERIAMKCTPVTSKSSRREAIKEWFLLKIASIAQIGPKIQSYLGFDILMYEECVEFPMEQCETLTFQNYSSDCLFSNLSLMHQIHLIHCDIKPQNVMFSRELKKPVFIDFGLSKLVEEEIGENSLTTYVGTINFCSDEMRSCLLSESARRVDLYFNDLCCLEGSLRFLSYRSYCFDDQFGDQTQEIDQTKETEFTRFDYIKLFMIKYCLFGQNISETLRLWDKFLSQEEQRRYKSELLDFLSEFMPNDQLKQFFYHFVKDQEIDSLQCSTIKFVYEMSQENVFAVNLLQNPKKKALFDSYIEEIDLKTTSGREFESYRASIAELMVNRQAVAKMPFSDYAALYLKYMSYLSNRFRVTASAREEAARVYYACFISQTIPLDTTGRQLIEITIKNILQWLLRNISLQQNAHSFALLAFRLHEFLVVLEPGTCEQIIQWLSKLYCCLGPVYKKLFVQRVFSANELNNYRATKLKGIARVDYICLINNWIRKHVEDLRILDNESEKQSQATLSTAIPYQRTVGEDFLKQFQEYRINFETFEQPDKQGAGGLSFSIPFDKDQRYNFCFNFLKMFKKVYEKRTNIASCFKILKILRQNLADETILEQFSFRFLLNIAHPLFIHKNILLSQEIYSQALNYLDKVDLKDLILFDDFIIALFNRITMMSTTVPSVSVLMQGQSTIFSRLVKAQLEYLKQHLFLSKEEHICLQETQLYDLYCMSKIIKSRDSEIRQLFQANSISKLLCPYCQALIRSNSVLLKVNDYFTDYLEPKDSKATCEQQQSLIKMFEEIAQLQKQLAYLNISLKVRLKILGLGQLICCLDLEIEKKFHGIINYYQFALQHGLFSDFFEGDLQRTRIILKTLEALEMYEGKHIQFLFALAQHIESTLLFEHYFVIWIRCYQFFDTFSEQQLQNCFYAMKAYAVKQNRNTIYIAMIYLVMIMKDNSWLIRGKIRNEIIKRVQKLHFRFQRQVLTRLYERDYLNLQQTDKPNRRKWRFYNNNLVKQYMIEGQTIPSKPLKNAKSPIHAKLLTKAQKMGRVKKGVRFQMK